MQLIPFLELISKPDLLLNHTHICLSISGDYPQLFCSAVINTIKSNTQLSFESLDLEQVERAHVQSALEMSFLGSHFVYWLRNVHTVSGKDGQSLLTYLKAYRGPHRIIYALGQEQVPTIKEALIIEVPELINKAQFIKIVDLTLPGSARKNSAIINEAFASAATIPLESAYMLMQYLNVVGTQQEDFIRTWLGSLIGPEKSLFTLSTHFFAKDAQTFFKQWAVIKDDYADAFWVTFWSEQIWRAAQVIHYMQRNEMVEAKKVAFRLPFSFTQRDWRKFTQGELQQTHNFLYTMDYGLKNGGDAGIFDVFFTKFFLGEFYVGK